MIVLPYAKVDKPCENPRCDFFGELPKNQKYCSPECYHNWMRYDRGRYLDNLTKTFDVEMVVEGNVLCMNDLHIPYTCPDIFRKALAIKDKFEVTKVMLGGDIFNADALKGFSLDGNIDDFPFDKEVDATEAFFEVLLDEFDEVYVFLGNHDDRVLRALKFAITGKQLGKLALPPKLVNQIDERVFFSNQRFAEIYSKDELFRYTHPKNYSRNPPKVERELAQIFDSNVLSTHGHMFATGFDRSGRHVVAQLGAMIDQEKVPYVNYVDTTHPRWNKGFGLVYEGHLYTFAEGITDWRFWLGSSIDPMLHTKEES